MIPYRYNKYHANNHTLPQRYIQRRLFLNVRKVLLKSNSNKIILIMLLTTLDKLLESTKICKKTPPQYIYNSISQKRERERDREILRSKSKYILMIIIDLSATF